MRRLLGLLPRGTIAVGAGLVVLGGASYVHLSVASRALSTQSYDGLAVLWSIVFTIGLGLFFPIEQEITRIVANRRVTGDGSTPVFRRGALLALIMILVLFVLLAAGSGPLAHWFFSGDRSLVLVMAGGLLGLAVCYPSRGVLAGTGRFAAYGTQLAVDGGLRIVLAVLLGAFGVHSVLPYGLILTVAPLISVAVTAPAVRRGLSAGTALAWRTFGRGVTPLMISTLLAQLVVNIAVINVKLLDPDAIALAGALLNALVLARVPLFVFASLQASLLPGLSTAATAGDRAGFRRLMLRAGGLVVVFGMLGAAIAVPLGPWLIRIIFGTGGVLGDLDFALLSAGTAAYLLAQVLGQGVLALGHHRDQTLAWLGGSVALVLVTALPGDIRLRVEVAYAVGSAVVALILAIAVARRARVPHDPDPRATADPAPAALISLGGVEG